MHQEAIKFIWLILLWWSGTKPIISLRYTCAFIKLYELLNSITVGLMSTEMAFYWKGSLSNLPVWVSIMLAGLPEVDAWDLSACISLLCTIPVHIYVWLYLAQHFLSWTLMYMFLFTNVSAAADPRDLECVPGTGWIHIFIFSKQNPIALNSYLYQKDIQVFIASISSFWSTHFFNSITNK